MRLHVLVLIAAALATGCSDGGDSPAKVNLPEPAGTAITNVTVIDGINGVRENQTIVFDGDQIIAVQPYGDPVSAIEYIDGSGKYLIPGLWDFHIHLTNAEFFRESYIPSLLSYGITSVRDTGGPLDVMLPLVEKYSADDSIAPRIFHTGPLLDGEYVVYDGSSPFRPPNGTSNTMTETARDTVAELKAAGASFIKIYEMVSPEVFTALVDAADAEGLPVAAHIPLSTLAGESGPSIGSMEHLRNVLLDCASNADELLVERRSLLENDQGLTGGDLRSSIHAEQRPIAVANFDETRCDATIKALTSTIQVPTLTLNSGILKPYFRDDWQEALNRLPEPGRSVWVDISADRAANDDGTPIPNDDDELTFAERQLWLVKRMHDMGVPIAAGTDVPVPITIPGYNLHLELAALVHAGLSPLDAITAATVRPAEFFSLEEEMGSIDIGKKADMVLLNQDPLEDIENTTTISKVITKGVVLNEEDIALLIQESANPSS